MTSTLLRPLALLLAGATLGAPLCSQLTDIRRALPTETLAFVRLPDLLRTQQEFLDAPIARMAREKDLLKFLAPLLDEAEGEWQRAVQRADTMHENGRLPLSAAELQSLRLASAALALTRVDFDVAAERLDVGILLHLDFGTSAPQWRRLIEFGLDAVQQRAPRPVRRETKKIAGAELLTFSPPEDQREHTSMALSVAFHGSGMLVGTLQSDVEGALTRLAMAAGGNAAAATGGEAGGLAASASYRTVADHLSVDGCEVEVFVRVDELLDLVVAAVQAAAEAKALPIDGDGLERALTAIGLRGVKAFGMSSTYRGQQSVSKTFTHAPAPERRGLFAGGSKTLDLGFLRWVPKDAVSFSASTFDIAGIYNAIFGGLRAYDEDLADHLQGRLAAFEERMGVSLKEDLVGALGHQVVSWSMPMSGNAMANPGAFLSGTWLVQVRDQERLVKGLKALAQLTNGMIEMGESERKGVKTYWLQAHLDGAPDMPIDVSKLFVPNFTFQNGYMVVGLQKADLRKALVRLERTEDDDNDIRSNPEFAKQLEQLPKEKLDALAFTDWKTQFAGWYDLAYNFSFLFGSSLPIDPAELPEDPIFLNQHLFASVSWSTSDGMGFETTTVSPWGVEVPAGLGAVAVGGGVLWSAAVPRARAMQGPRPVRVLPREPVKPEEAKQDRKSEGDGGETRRENAEGSGEERPARK